MINKETRRIWAEKTFELTNIGAGALIFGQFLSEKKLSLLFILSGIILVGIGYFLSYIFLKGTRQ